MTGTEHSHLSPLRTTLHDMTPLVMHRFICYLANIQRYLLTRSFLQLHPLSTEYASDIVARAHAARQLAHDRLSLSQAYQKDRYDSRHRKVHFPPGSLVLLWTPSRQVGLSEKLLPRYNGPYKVLQLSYVNYEVTPLDTASSTSSHQTNVVHVSRLKPYCPPSPSLPYQAP